MANRGKTIQIASAESRERVAKLARAEDKAAREAKMPTFHPHVYAKAPVGIDENAVEEKVLAFVCVRMNESKGWAQCVLWFAIFGQSTCSASIAMCEAV